MVCQYGLDTYGVKLTPTASGYTPDHFQCTIGKITGKAEARHAVAMALQTTILPLSAETGFGAGLW